MPRGQPNLSIGTCWSLNCVSFVSKPFRVSFIIEELREFESSLRKMPFAESAISFRALESSLDFTRLPLSSFIKVWVLPRDLSSGIIEPFSEPSPMAIMIVPFSWAFFASWTASPSRFSPSVKRTSAWLFVSLFINTSVDSLIASARFVPPLATAYVSSWSIDSLRASLSGVIGTITDALPENAINPIRSSGRASIKS